MLQNVSVDVIATSVVFILCCRQQKIYMLINSNALILLKLFTVLNPSRKVAACVHYNQGLDTCMHDLEINITLFLKLTSFI